MHNVVDLELEFRVWESGDRFNFNGYCNSRVDQLIQQYQQTPPTPTQLWELRELIHQDVPDIPLFYNERLLTHTKRLHTLENQNPSITRLNEIHKWYLEANGEDEDRR
jgi:ABC-type oligopeptide transport system substrate-binding subunit